MILPLRTNHFMERAGQYGDLLFETMFYDGNAIRFATQHFERLTRGLSVLKMPKPYLSFQTFLELSMDAVSFGLNQNPDSKYFRIRFSAKREGEGFYFPSEALLNYQVTATPFSPKLNKTLTLGVYPDQTKAQGILANLKSGNALIYVMSAIYAKEMNWDECLILNTHGRIIESTSSNIFWFKNEQWYTPPLSEACIEGIGRNTFMQQHKVIESPCELIDLKNANKLILTNALSLQREFFLNP
jgi:branched-chain amino acid aminotransferase